MKQVSRQSYVLYSAKQMFALVDDVEKYPEFLPWCTGSRVLTRHFDAVTAELSLSKMGIHKSFTTKNTLTPYDSIAMTLVDGPFKSLDGVWSFEDLGDEGSKVCLDLSYETRGVWMDIAFGKVFDHVANHMVESFCQRAKEVYDD